MECPECGEGHEFPDGESLLLDDIFDDHVDVDESVQEHVQLECPDCGVILGYVGQGAAIGTQNIRGFY